MTNNPDLKCPRCGSTSQQRARVTINSHLSQEFCVCQNAKCRLRSPKFATEAEAIEWWTTPFKREVEPDDKDRIIEQLEDSLSSEMERRKTAERKLTTLQDVVYQSVQRKKGDL